MSFAPTEKIVDAILEGIKEAKANYTFWTADELYLSYAPQNFITIHVAQSIAKLENPPEIFIDASIADILRCSLSSRSEFGNFMYEKELPQDTFSLTLDDRKNHTSDNDSVSRAVISIKNGVRNAKEEFRREIHKLCRMLSFAEPDKSTLLFGCFAFYLDLSCSARKKTQKRVEEIVGAFDVIVKKYPNIKSYFKGGDVNELKNIGEWTVGCYVIEPNFPEKKL